MNTVHIILRSLAAAVAVFVSIPLTAQSNYEQWKNGPSADPGFFPIAVWLQSPSNAERFKAAGINTYVGLWRGPTEDQLDRLAKAGMKVICGQNRVGLENRENPVIIGWMHGDEPDNAQALPEGKGWGPPIPPAKVQKEYEEMRAADPTRPVLLNLGQGVAYDNYIGRGVRRNRMEDYPEYIKGCDIVSFDIYPVVHEKPEISGKLEFVARGVERLVKWSDGQKVVWNCIECTHIGNPKIKASPAQVRAEVWMSIIHGSRGLIYFVHQFEPKFREAALLDDPEMLQAITAINRQIQSLAPVLNQGRVIQEARVESSDAETPIAIMAREHEGGIYVFAVGMRNQPVRGRFDVPGLGSGELEVLGESRKVTAEGGEFVDEFKPYEVHLYRGVKGE